MNGYVGRFVLENGVDLYGNPWPLLYFDNFGDFPNIIPMYISGLSSLWFGLNPLAIRFPIALMGLVGIFLVYVLARMVFEHRSVALIAALFVTLQPWQTVLSRATAEGVTAASVLLAGVVLIFQGFRKQRWWYFVAGWIFFVATYLLYPGYRVFAPLFFAPTILIASKTAHRFLLSFLTLGLFGLTFFIAQTSWGSGRFEQTSLFSQQSEAYVYQQEFIAGIGNSNVFLARSLYNKPIMFGKQFFDNYGQYFSPEFLFSRGGKPDRYLVPNAGVLLVSTLFLVLFFVPRSLRSFVIPQDWRSVKFRPGHQPLYYWLLFMVLAAVVPAALTIDDVPNVHRALLMGLGLAFPVAYLASRTLHWRIWRVPVWLLIVGIWLFEFSYFGVQYLYQAPHYQAFARQADSREMVEKVALEHEEYERVFLPSSPANSLYYLWLKQDFSAEYASRFSSHLYIADVDNLLFYPENCPMDDVYRSLQASDLLVMHESCWSGLSKTEKARLVVDEDQANHIWARLNNTLRADKVN